MIASDPSRSDHRAANQARRESATQEKSEAQIIGLIKDREDNADVTLGTETRERDLNVFARSPTGCGP
jgi:hypothetical protein